VREQRIDADANARREVLTVRIVDDDLAPAGIVQLGQQDLQRAAAQMRQRVVQAGLDMPPSASARSTSVSGSSVVKSGCGVNSSGRCG
jgi:hypothetical protein